MLRAATGLVRDLIRQRGELIPLGFNWAFVVTTDVSIAGIVAIATLQRPTADLPISLLAVAVAVAPFVLFLILGVRATFKALALWACGTTASAIFLLGTSTPIEADFAPLLLVLTIGVVGAVSEILTGMLATGSAAALLITAAALHRLDAIALYLSFLGMGWLVGYLMHTQQRLIIKQQQAQELLAEHAAADERRRIAREVHDVIAHSLSITLLHTTAARRGLQQDRDVDDAVDALEQAERLGRQAMADIRRTVGLLDDGPMKVTPEPGIREIGLLVDDFVRAGVNVTLHTQGSVDHVSAAVGLALYRITQESLANIAKHAPDAQSTVLLEISRSSATLAIRNRLPVAVCARASEGRGLRGVRQRVEQLGGRVDIGPAGDEWTVRADIPLGEPGASRRWMCRP